LILNLKQTYIQTKVFTNKDDALAVYEVIQL